MTQNYSYVSNSFNYTPLLKPYVLLWGKEKALAGFFLQSHQHDYGQTVALAPKAVPITPTLVRAAPVLSTQ